MPEIIRIRGQAGGQNILYRKKSIAEVASSFGISETDLEIRIESIRARLFTARAAAIPPITR